MRAGQLGDRATAKQALHTVLSQRPEIGKLPRQEVAIWWQPELVEDLIGGLRKADLVRDEKLLTPSGRGESGLKHNFRLARHAF